MSLSCNDFLTDLFTSTWHAFCQHCLLSAHLKQETANDLIERKRQNALAALAAKKGKNGKSTGAKADATGSNKVGTLMHTLLVPNRHRATAAAAGAARGWACRVCMRALLVSDRKCVQYEKGACQPCCCCCVRVCMHAAASRRWQHARSQACVAGSMRMRNTGRCYLSNIAHTKLLNSTTPR